MNDHPTRRSVVLGTLVACASVTGAAAGDEDDPRKEKRPQKGDLLVFSEGERAGQTITPDDLKVGEPPVHAWPKDAANAIVRDGSRLNEVLLVRLDPNELDEDTRPRAAGGIVAYSAICSHAGCPVTAWIKATEGNDEVFKCMCHNSEYDPRRGAQVVFGPAPRRLAALPLVIKDGALVIAAPFIGKVGGQQG
ncbi:MAG: Rieske (2Fe-2S) protein [Bradyrhizobium sp.]|jgi:Rieske Fe-S protein|uniref:Rieske (2Fe-2S) protein n=1 Tax=Bradyrhizobium denitrificans TaxID=2734912 RepID=A0ABS5G4T4_9BRAD|nr:MULTISPECIES: Rieske (2Fe-2S) protein [Bradyrhizobium]MBR1136059.1 Rieske (2Fe-2S) protein [Bradyrhizobium denitrificans]MDU0959966.1 Rieske (2Fe-2S) protein [Bradyrhizobium sp.]MDU1494420.1 Rieske (2Fe-2S) protein [Bradyrhizobium sp.]MDU1544578.1 Rieske (2Fe-2S) protein [Bradyrhizobium sp.]MDU1665056.1 Rieske (2Fe-2S) protein [Bradyrhizobium sp.]